ncbi:RnfH family protein [Aliikangiella marina]|uniref:RnfH family protein n=1 Tax=Aliikangiella marina TaxID=1712262 RepID=UPI00163DD345|nr:RnfH family protein [Aliikangiella marina]
MAELIKIELIYALPDEQDLIELDVKDGTTIEQAIIQSGLLERYPQIDLQSNKVGIFSKVAKLDTTLREGDRIEIYRPLIADPKEVRKRKAAMQKEAKK